MVDEVVAGDLIKQLVSKIEHLESDKSNIMEEIREAYAEAKSQGIDVPALKKVIQLRKKDKDKLEREEEMVQLYREVVGV